MLCIRCGEAPVQIQKRGLCLRCYQAVRKEGFESMDFTSKAAVGKVENAGEVAFVQNFFGDLPFIHQPAKFNIKYSSYTPDFYDVTRNTFIEVIATRQAFHQNKDKYDAMRNEFPQVNFEIRHASGEMLTKNSNGDYAWNN